MRRTERRFSALLRAAVICAVSSSTAALAWPGRIVFSGQRRDVRRLYTIEDNGRRPRPLTMDHREYVRGLAAGPLPFDDLWPAWSPDGTRVAFVRQIEAVRRVPTTREVSETVTVPGRMVYKEVDLGDVADKIKVPSGYKVMAQRWEPEHLEVVTRRVSEWTSARCQGQAIYVVDAATGTEEPVVGYQWDVDLGPPRWSPDGHDLAYKVREGKEDRIVIADSRAPATEPAGQVAGCDPDWSPTAERIAFSTEKGIRIMDATASVTVPLVIGDGSVTYRYPRWSPNGRQLAFYRLTPTTDLVVLDLPTGKQTALMKDLPVDAVNSPPCWSPDGTGIGLPVGQSILILSVAGGTQQVVDTGDWTPYALDWTE